MGTRTGEPAEPRANTAERNIPSAATQERLHSVFSGFSRVFLLHGEDRNSSSKSLHELLILQEVGRPIFDWKIKKI